MLSSRLLARPRTIALCLKRYLFPFVAVILIGAFSISTISAANNQVPFVDIVSPVSINPGSTGVTLTVKGTGFVPASLIVWNGTSLSTTFVNSKELTSSLPDTFVAAVGHGFVAVMSPAPGGGKSNVILVPIVAAEASTTFPSTPTSTVNVGSKPQGLVMADFNADGILDIAVANNLSGDVSILLGNGDGTFTTKSTSSAGSGANWLAVGDFNEDGNLDLAVANFGSIGAGGVSILLGNGDGTFTLGSSPSTGRGPFAVATGDFNGDGHLDLAVTNQTDGTVTILLGQGNGTFASGVTLTVGSKPQAIVAGDFNEDGILDLAVSNMASNTVSVLLGIGDGSFQSQATFSSGGSGSPSGLIATDFNGDGHLDLAAVNVSDVGILVGNGNGSFALKANPGTGTSDLTDGVSGDFNGDGKTDLVVSDRTAGKVFLLGGVGDGTFSPAVTFTTAVGAYGVATADFNGDGALDLAISNATANNLSIFLQLLPVSLNPTSLSFGDQHVGTPSSPQAVTLTNNSGSTLNFTSIGFVGTSSGDFSQNNTCGSSISNSGTCTISVTFTPSVEGPRSATLTLVDNASNSPQTLAVSGNGAAPPVITSANNTTFILGMAGSFTITTSGFPIPSLSEVGSLPSAVTFTDNGNGTATLAGTPGLGTDGSYTFNITAVNGLGTDSQTFTLTVVIPPTITKAFGAASIPLNVATSLTFTITNVNKATTLTGVAFTDSLPAGLVVATPNNLNNTCGGTTNAILGAASASLSSGTLAAMASCTVSVNVMGTAAGIKNNNVQVTSTEGGTGNTSNASTTVVAPPVVIKVFGAPSIPLNGSTSLTFTIQNNNTTTSLTGIGFRDTLPAGLVISTPNGQIGTCGGGTITNTQGTNVISLTGATLAQSSSCNFTVNVTGTSAGTQNNTTSNVTSNEGGTGGTAAASIDVVAPPTISKAFSPTTITLNGTTALTFTITNPAANTVALTGVAFADTLPTGLVVSTPNGLSNTCGGTATAVAGSTIISLTGGTINAPNTTCIVNVTVTGTSAGQYTNTTGAVSSTNGGAGNIASANVTVTTPPTITKAFGAGAIPLSGTTSLTFTITNPSTAGAMTGVAFSDSLPAGLVVSTPNGLTGTCGTGNVTATAGSQSVSLTGGTIATSGSCVVSVNVTATIAGNQVNTTGSVSAIIVGTVGGTGNTATASLNVLAPDLTIAKSHAGNFFQGQNGATYTLTVSNTGAGPTAGVVAVTDTLPTGLTATAIGGLGWSCTIATISCVRSDTLAVSASYPVITVTVNVAANAASSVTNNATVSGGGELNVANDAASDVTTITLPPDFTISVVQTKDIILPGQQASYEITITPINNVFANPITFAASGLPARTSLAFNPSPVTPGANPASSTLVVSTTAGDPFVANASRRTRMPLYGALLPLAGLVLSGFGFCRYSRKNGWILVFAILLCGGLGTYGCVGSQANFQSLSTPIGTYTVTITATSGTLQHSTSVMLVVHK
jgi:uncharacterized repeat protein (TIGR01451 family)